MKKRFLISGLLIGFLGLGFTSCGPSKKELAAADSARRADSLVRMEAEKARIKQQLLDSIENENRNKKEEKKAVMSVKPLTQYALIDPGKGTGPSIREESKLKSLLTGLGFKVTLHKRPASVDEMEPFIGLRATRAGNGGNTKVMLEYGEDPKIYIDFANMDEANKFEESMIVSKYTKSGNLYSNPYNNYGKVFVKMNGKSATVIMPWEMLPSNF